MQNIHTDTQSIMQTAGNNPRVCSHCVELMCNLSWFSFSSRQASASFSRSEEPQAPAWLTTITAQSIAEKDHRHPLGWHRLLHTPPLRKTTGTRLADNDYCILHRWGGPQAPAWRLLHTPPLRRTTGTRLADTEYCTLHRWGPQALHTPPLRTTGTRLADTEYCAHSTAEKDQTPAWLTPITTHSITEDHRHSLDWHRLLIHTPPLRRTTGNRLTITSSNRCQSMRVPVVFLRCGVWSNRQAVACGPSQRWSVDQ